MIPRLTLLAGIDIITAEAMTLAHQLARGEKTAHDIIDEGYNKYAFRDRDGLPDWFLDDESKHSKPHKPITKEAAQAIKEKLRALNARPIKKVAEAKARKKLKQAQKLEKLKKKADLLLEDEVRWDLPCVLITLHIANELHRACPRRTRHRPSPSCWQRPRARRGSLRSRSSRRRASTAASRAGREVSRDGTRWWTLV